HDRERGQSTHGAPSSVDARPNARVFGAIPADRRARRETKVRRAPFPWMSPLRRGRRRGGRENTMSQDFPSVWPLRCPRCARRTLIELAYGAEPGRTGIDECPVGHAFLFRYDGVTVSVLRAVAESAEDSRTAFRGGASAEGSVSSRGRFEGPWRSH